MRHPWVALAAGAALAGCGTHLPTPSGVHTVRPVTGAVAADDPDLRKIPAGPAPDATPEQVVRGWLGAASDPTTARRFLRPREQWEPTASTFVYTDPFTLSLSPGADSETATVAITTIAEVSADGGLRAAPGTRTLVLGLQRTDEQWRLSSVPAGVVVPSRELRIGRCSVRLAWLSVDRTSTVPEDVLLPTCDPSDRLSEVTATVSALLAGPPQHLGGTVVATLPAPATLASPVRIVAQATGGDVVVIDLAGGASTADPVALAELRQQVQRSVPSVATVQLKVDGQPPPTTTGGSTSAAVILSDPDDGPEGIVALPPSAAREVVAPDGRAYARLRAVSSRAAEAELGTVRAGNQPVTWSPLGPAQAWQHVALSRDRTVWLSRSGRLWAVPAGSSEPQPVVLPVPLDQVLPGRDGVHAAGVSPKGAVVALLLRGGSAPKVVLDQAGSRAGADLRVIAASPPDADGTVLAEAVRGGHEGLFRVQTVLTPDHLGDAADDPLVSELPRPCPAATVVRLSTAPDRPDLAWCQEASGAGTARALAAGTWQVIGSDGPRVYPGS